MTSQILSKFFKENTSHRRNTERVVRLKMYTLLQFLMYKSLNLMSVICNMKFMLSDKNADLEFRLVAEHYFNDRDKTTSVCDKFLCYIESWDW